MESRIYGVPLSAAQMGPSNNTFSGIRAPLTVDESDSNGSGSDYSGSEYDGFESGEDVLETSGVVKEEGDIVEETVPVKKVSISEDAVVGLSGEITEGSSSNERGFIKESGSVSENAVFRPFARIPNGRMFKRTGSYVDYDASGSFLSGSSDDELAEDENYVGNYSNSRPVAAVVGDEVSEEERTPVMSLGVPAARKLSIPIAKISGDSDDDSGGSEVMYDEGFSGILRAPRIKVLDRINSAPKVRMLEADEGPENKSQAEDVVEMQLDGNLLASGMVFSPLDDKGPIVVESSLVQDNGLDFNEETMASSSSMNDILNPTSESGRNVYLIHLDEEIKEVDIVDDFKERPELVDHRDPDNFVEGVILPDTSDVASVAEFEFVHDKLTVPEVDETGSNNYFGATSLGILDSTRSNTSLEDNHIFNRSNESKIMESMKQEIDHQCVDVKEVPPEGCLGFPELPETVTESIPISLSDSLFEDASQSVFKSSNLEQETGRGAETSDSLPGEVELSRFHSDNKAAIAEREMVQDSTTSHAGGILLVEPQDLDGQVFENLDDDMDADGGTSDQRHIIDPLAVLKGVRSAVSDDDAKFVSVDGTDTSYLETNSDDFGILDSAGPSIVARSPSGVDPSSTNDEQNEALSGREKEKIKKIERLGVNYLHLLHRLGRSPEDHVASKVLYQLTLASGSSHSQACHLDSLKIASMELESHGKDDNRLPLSILIIGKTGVGKSATINSIFGESVAMIDAFEPATTHVKEIVGLINGVKLKVFDTPGFRTSMMDQSLNLKILSSIKKLMKKSPPDVILYVDRVDTQRGSLNDLPLMRLVTSCLGSSIWRKSIVAFTHGTSLPPDGPHGYPLSYEAFVSHQSRIIQRLISHSAGEPVVGSSGSTVPVCVIENHRSIEKNGHGETLFHSEESWRSQLLLLCFSIKILSELSSLVMSRSTLDYGRLFGLQICSPPLSCLPSFVQSSVHPELSNDQRGDIVGKDLEICYSSDSNQEDIEHDNLPSLKPQTSSQINELSREQLEAYSKEYDYRVKSLLKKEMRQIRSLRRSKDMAGNETYMYGVSEQETEAKDSDGDDPSSFRHHVSEPSSQFLTRPRPVLYHWRWEPDCIYNNLLHEGLDILILEEKLPCSLKGKTKINNFRKNETAAGVSITFVGEYMVSGLEVADRIPTGKQNVFVGNAGIIQSPYDAAYALNFDLCRRDRDHPTNQDETWFGMSVMRCRDDLIYGCNLHSQIPISRSSKLDITAALNNRLRGHISVKTSSCDQLQIAALALIPIAGAAAKKLFRQSRK